MRFLAAPVQSALVAVCALISLLTCFTRFLLFSIVFLASLAPLFHNLHYLDAFHSFHSLPLLTRHSLHCLHFFSLFSLLLSSLPASHEFDVLSFTRYMVLKTSQMTSELGTALARFKPQLIVAALPGVIAGEHGAQSNVGRQDSFSGAGGSAVDGMRFYASSCASIASSFTLCYSRHSITLVSMCANRFLGGSLLSSHSLCSL